ncbi:MAG: hypothetical protein ONB46_04525 [candidate division KSB1 bacterium]|nr:hypothetical protein [candidate division KSB1 bacterium]MDZ7365114.1 hypothetical protein [candidate division KSB1 bacterium]MDZ7404324.1 hypothetical protein [candidate division KSB1 bacterium]
MEGFLRPAAAVLAEEAIVPPENLISPAPNQFTHELKHDTPYYFTGSPRAKRPDGHFAAGTKVTLLVYDGGDFCRVVDGQGLYVEIAYDALQEL